MRAKNSLWKRITSVVLVMAFFILIIPTNVKAEAPWPQGPSINTPSAIVMEVNSGTVLYEKNSAEVNYPASITKILTTLLALEYCELDEVVTFSADAVFKNEGDSSHIARDLGEEMTMEQCLYAVMLESANECAYAVAEHVGAKLGGDYQTFIDLMNEKVAELGCTNTHFNNANGLPDENHYTSAYDMALISAEAYKNENFREITGTRSYKIAPTNKHDEITPLNNHHAMLHYYKTRKYLYDYCTGGKTGYTAAAGSTLVTFAEKDGMSLVCVVMRTTSEYQYTETTQLLEYGFQNFKTVSIAENESAFAEDEKDKGLWNNYESYVTLSGEGYIVLPTTAEYSDVEMTLSDTGLANDTIAELEYTYGNHTVGRVDVILSDAEVGQNLFDYAEQLEEDSEVNVVKIKTAHIWMLLFILLVIVVIILLIKRLYDNYYVIRHDMEVKRERRDRFREISKKKKRRRKKDSMFK